MRDTGLNELKWNNGTWRKSWNYVLHDPCVIKMSKTLVSAIQDDLCMSHQWSSFMTFEGPSTPCSCIKCGPSCPPHHTYLVWLNRSLAMPKWGKIYLSHWLAGVIVQKTNTKYCQDNYKQWRLWRCSHILFVWLLPWVKWYNRLKCLLLYFLCSLKYVFHSGLFWQTSMSTFSSQLTKP